MYSVDCAMERREGRERDGEGERAVQEVNILFKSYVVLNVIREKIG